MPTASPQVRKPWHEKKAWVRIEKAWNRGRLIWKNDQAGAWVFMRWMRIESGDIAALEFLKKRGYLVLRGMIYAPKRVQSDVFWGPTVFWRPTKKEFSALDYLVNEWDYSYDLRPHKGIVVGYRDQLVREIGETMMKRECIGQTRLVQMLNRFAELVQVLS